MTRKKQEKVLARADEIMCEAHALLLDVYWARRNAGAVIQGDALTHAIGLLSHAIDTLRDTGESPRYLAAWERKSD